MHRLYFAVFFLVGLWLFLSSGHDYYRAHQEAVLERGVAAEQRSSGMAGLVIGLIFLIFSASLFAMRTFVIRRVASAQAGRA